MRSPHSIFAPSRRARKGRLPALVWGVLGVYLAACSGSGSADGTSDGSGASSGSAGMSTTPSVTLSIRAVSPTDGMPVDATKLVTRQTVTLIATAKPAVARQLRFALVGDAFDAALSATDVPVDSLNGTAEVTLTAPSMPTAFDVRVSTMGAEPFSFPVVVPETGVAKLDVWASYGGKRAVTQYTATAWENKTCADLQGAPPADGEVSATSATFPVTLDVKTGVPLAVILRAAKYIWGCETLDSAREGTLAEVDVTMTDVPIALDRSHVRFSLELEPSTPWVDALEPAKEVILAALLEDETDDVDALLDAMQESLDDDDDATAFDSTRRAENWDGYVREAVPHGAEALRGTLGDWIDAGVEGLSYSKALVGDVKGLAGVASPPQFTLQSAFGMSPARSTFTEAGEATWNAAADDSVLIGVSVTFEPNGLLLGAATGAALDSFTKAKDLAEALSLSLCPTVAATLVAHGESAEQSLDGCDLECTEELCHTGVETLFARTSLPSPALAKFDVGITGGGSVGDDANLTQLSGSWLGKLAMPDPSGTEPPEEPSPAPITLNGYAFADALP